MTPLDSLSVYLSLSAIFTNINIKWSVTCTAAQTPEHLIWIWYNLMVIFRLLALLLAAVQTHEYVVYSLEWLFFLTWVHFLFLLLEHSSQMILWMISWTTFWTILWTISGTIFRNLFGDSFGDNFGVNIWSVSLQTTFRNSSIKIGILLA